MSEEEKIEEETYSLIFASLKHPIRRRILRMLTNKSLAFSEILDALSIDSGHLSYHIENLGDLVTHTSDGKYALSSIGVAAVRLMSGVEEHPIPSRVEVRLSFRMKTFIAGLMTGLIVLSIIFGHFVSVGSRYQTSMLYIHKHPDSGRGAALPNGTDLYELKINEAYVAVPKNFWIGDEVSIFQMRYTLAYINEGIISGVKIEVALFIFPPGLDPRELPGPGRYENVYDYYEGFAMHTFHRSSTLNRVGQGFFPKIEVKLEGDALNLTEGEEVKLRFITMERFRCRFPNGTMLNVSTTVHFTGGMHETYYMIIKNPDSSDRIHRSMKTIGENGLIGTAITASIATLCTIALLRKPISNILRGPHARLNIIARALKSLVKRYIWP